MPKITEAHRVLRRQQILEAAWRCFFRGGVQATTMQDIIVESGLSASAMYRYFVDKEDIILAAIAASLGGLEEVLQPLFVDESIDGPAELATRIAVAVDGFAHRRGFDLRPIAVQGWAEAQRNDRVRGLIGRFYAAFRDRLVEHARRWQKSGAISRGTKPLDVANAVQALVLGHVVQAAILGDVDPKRIARGLAAP